eukprot:scaffold34618_cov159-Amphora_coffeaeformis.AAC.13
MKKSAKTNISATWAGSEERARSMNPMMGGMKPTKVGEINARKAQSLPYEPTMNTDTIIVNQNHYHR